MEVAVSNLISLKDFDALLRKSSEELKTYLSEVELCFKINETKACTSCHFINLTASGQVRFKDFASFLAKKVIDFAIPHSEILDAFDHYNKTNSLSKIAALHTKALSLFSSLKKSGEGGEVLLYILIEEILKVPQILCKMNLKTSSEMHVHGCDGIHATYDDNEGMLSLYWGESKLFQDINKAIEACLSSVKDFLLDCGGTFAAQERDIQLIRSYVDLPNQQLEDAIVNFLDKDNPNFNRVIYKGACLIGFDYNGYPNRPSSGASIESLKCSIEKEINKWKSSIENKIKKIDGLERFELQFFLLPFPSVQEFRNSFLKELGINRTDDVS